jgi:Ca2+-binding EF-hand superfamily protein
MIRNMAILTVSVTLNAGCMMAARAVTHQGQTESGRIFDSADTNGDGVITRAEFFAAQERLFTRLDRDADGYVDKDDQSHRLAGRSKAQGRLAELVARLDKDGDGRISEAEFLDGSAFMFDRADADHNGELSTEEVAAAKQKMAQRRGS